MNRSHATVAIPGYRVGSWTALLGDGEIAFSVRFLALGKVHGRFAGYGVTLVTRQNPYDSAVAATIDAASIDTGNEKRDSHLRSADYLDVRQYPTMSYRSTGVGRAEERWIIDGELTLRGVTRQVPLDVEGFAFSEGRRAVFSATAQIDRRDFGIHVPMDGGGTVTGRIVSIGLQICLEVCADTPPGRFPL